MKVGRKLLFSSYSIGERTNKEMMPSLYTPNEFDDYTIFVLFLFEYFSRFYFIGQDAASLFDGIAHLAVERVGAV